QRAAILAPTKSLGIVVPLLLSSVYSWPNRLGSIAGTVVQSPFDCAQQTPGIERLVHEIHGTPIESSPPRFVVKVAGYKDDRQPWILCSDAPLQFESIHSWHPNVSNHATRSHDRPGAQKIFGA